MERQYEVTMIITVDDDVIKPKQTVDELVLDALEEAPFQVDTVTVTTGQVEKKDECDENGLSDYWEEN